MILCKVVGSVIATRKHEKLVGSKFMVVEPLNSPEGCFVAVDNIGAGVGDRVMVVRGSGARLVCNAENAPVDAAIVGIIDEGTY